MKINREWAMPNKNTFSIIPIKLFVEKYLSVSEISIDPFARNKHWATHTNDLNPDTKAKSHLKAIDFLALFNKNTHIDLVLFDPPYSLRQTKECYDTIGIKLNYKETINGYWKAEKNLASQLLKTKGIILSFGWNSIGMGINRGFTILEILLVCHGGGHNDTICVAEQKTSEQLELI